MDLAFSLDITTAFYGPINYAKNLGVNEDEILDSKEKIDAYFLN